MVKYGDLMSEDHKTSGVVGAYWKVIVAFRWTLTLLIMVFLREYSGIQILILLVISIFFQVVMFASRPMKDLGNHRMSVFNESATALYLYFMLMLTDYMDDTSLREEIGWCLMSIVGGVVFVNLFRVLSHSPHYFITGLAKTKKCFKSKDKVYK